MKSNLQKKIKNKMQFWNFALSVWIRCLGKDKLNGSPIVCEHILNGNLAEDGK